MKNLKLNALRTILSVVVATAALSFIYAGGGIEVKPVYDHSKVIVSIQNLNQQHVKLSIEDLEGQTVYYTESVNKADGINKVFDISALEDGKYVIVAKARDKVYSEIIDVQDSKISVEEVTEVKSPIFKQVGESLIVIFDNSSEATYSVSFYDATTMFFSDETKEEFMAKKYDLSALVAGDYSVQVSAQGKAFNHTFSIEK